MSLNAPIIILILLLSAFTVAKQPPNNNNKPLPNDFMRSPLIYGAISHALANSTLHTNNYLESDDALCTLTLDTSKPIWKYFNYTGKSPNDLGFY